MILKSNRGAPLDRTVRRRRRIDRMIGIVFGVLLGLAIVAAFVFLSSEGSVDAPRIHHVHTGKTGEPPPPATRP